MAFVLQEVSENRQTRPASPEGLPDMDYLCPIASTMPFFRNFTYWIDKRRWKYVFLLTTLELAL